MADEYIRREDAIRLAEQGQVQGFPWQFQMLVRLSPADVMKVIRCGQCKYWQDNDSDYDYGYCYAKDGHGFGHAWGKNDFCSYGERKE